MPLSKPKTSLKQFKGKKKKEQPLETVEDYLAQGVDDEDAMGKHRAGAPDKSYRFAQKALTVYNEGLKRYPSSFDLAYNKARLELEVATHPVLAGQLPFPLLSALEEALASHEYALKLDSENADLLFNTAQVLTAIAEERANTDNDSLVQPLHLLSKAIELQQKCLQIQYSTFLESQSQRDKALARIEQQFDEDAAGGVKLSSDDAQIVEQREEDEQWVSVVEPVTEDTVQDTYVARLHTITTLCSVVLSSISASMSLEHDEISAMVLIEKASSETPPMTSQRADIAIAKANLAAIFLEAAYRLRRFSTVEYQAQLNAAFAQHGDQQDSFDFQIVKAKSLMSFSIALAEVAEYAPTTEQPIAQLAEARWTALSTALSTLTAASKLKDMTTEKTATTHLLRGDASLLCNRLVEPPWQYQQAISNSVQLLKNGEVFYKNASKLFASSSMIGPSNVSGLRCGISKALQAGPNVTMTDLSQLIEAHAGSSDERWRKKQVEEMVDEGLIPLGLFGP